MPFRPLFRNLYVKPKLTAMKKSILLISIILIVFKYSYGVLTENNTKLQVGVKIEKELQPGEECTFFIEPPVEQFIFAEIYQKDVDVSATVYGPEDEWLGKFDEMGAGFSELFHFESSKVGTYKVVVSPFMAGKGMFTIELKKVVPLAKTKEERAAQIIESYCDKDSPGGAVAVLYNGNIVYKEAYGLSCVTYNEPFTVETSSNIGSIAKQFTGFAILMLESQGKLNLEDDIRKYIPELSHLQEPITIQNLLNHTTGFRGFFHAYLMTGITDWTREQVIEIILRQQKLQFTPGTEFRYTNTNYILLAEIVERVTGEKFPDWMQNNVFEPLNMTNTTIRLNGSQVVKNSAEGYSYDMKLNRIVKGKHLDAWYGASSIYSTVGDMCKWLNNFSNNQIGNTDIISRYTKRGILTNGDTIKYANGLFIDSIRGLKRYTHTGSDGGHRSSMVYYPDIKAGIVCVENGRPHRLLINALSDIYFDSHLQPIIPPKPLVPTESEDSNNVKYPLSALVGKYGNSELDRTIVIEKKGNHLWMSYGKDTSEPTLELHAINDSTFTDKNDDVKITFHQIKKSGYSATIWFRYWREFKLNKLKPYAPSKEELDEYIGLYYSPEFEITLRMVLGEENLTLKHYHLEDIILKTKQKDIFNAGWPLSVVNFNRAEDGMLISFESENVVYEKVK